MQVSPSFLTLEEKALTSQRFQKRLAMTSDILGHVGFSVPGLSPSSRAVDCFWPSCQVCSSAPEVLRFQHGRVQSDTSVF